jgi:baculoviral IAP repeat-containing protein 7/8
MADVLHSDSDDEIDMQQVANRFESFKNWPHSFLDPQILAVLGFYYIGAFDRVRCVYCGMCLQRWSRGDCPRQEHDRCNPRCIKAKQRCG